MSDELLAYYNQELTFIRKMGAAFAKANPKIAGRLRLGADVAEDPHVERLIEAFAYLNARTRHKIEDDFPEISSAVLNVLYPHYLAPVPSSSIVQFELDPAHAELTDGYTIDRHAPVETEPIEGQPCRFRTCYPVTLWPIRLVEASFKGVPFEAPATRHAPRTQAVVRLVIECLSEKVTFADLRLDRLRFYLKGQSRDVHELFELLLASTLDVAVAASPGDEPALLGKSAVQPVGFGRDEAVLPYGPRSFAGYRLLTEFFAFPEKFLFIDVAGLTPSVTSRRGRRMELFFLLDRYSRDLERNVTTDAFQLGCTPMVNLFRRTAEPIRLTHTQPSYRVVPDARRPAAHEVYSVDRVVATSPAGETREFQPFYSTRHGLGDRSDIGAYWYASRQPAIFSQGEVDRGTEVSLTLVDLDFNPAAAANWTLAVETTCLNRDVPHRLPFGGGQPRLQVTVGAPLSRIECLTPPTPTRRPPLRHGTMWRLISHFSLNHLSLVNSDKGAEALREMLKLYDFTDSAETRASIEGLTRVASRPVVGRTGGQVSSGFCRGVEVTLQFDEERFTGGGLYLFALVLERFLGLYCSINSFTKTIATTESREAPLGRWPPRAGERVLA